MRGGPRLVLGAIVLGLARGCGRGEWSCGERCVAANKFCDGVRNCEDGSDEPPGCTHCNRTYSGRSEVKYPLRVSGPSQRFLPFHCTLRFVATPGEALEIGFLSFHVGRLHASGQAPAECDAGFLRLSESRPASESGMYCGRMSGSTPLMYYARSGNVTLEVAVPGRASAQPFGLFLTYRFARRRRPDSDPHYGDAVPGTPCDRVFRDCHRRRCRIRSLGFPGLYPRNLTCRYRVVQGPATSVALHQRDDARIAVPRGPTVAGAPATTDCPGGGDALAFYDGPTVDAPLLARFCGDGGMTPVVSSGPEVLVVLTSAPCGLPTEARVEIDVEGRYDVDSTLRQRGESRCSFVVDASRHPRRGVVDSPPFTLPPNSSCTYEFVGASPHDRVWWYFVSYRSGDGDARMEMYDGEWPRAAFGGEDSSAPRMCTHASDYPPRYEPERPCRYPRESYLSSGSKFAVRHGRGVRFVARYEFVDLRQDGEAVPGTECDRRFDSRVAQGGFLASPGNVFLFGRGGSENLSCAFRFSGLPEERVRITVTALKLPDTGCATSYDAVAGRHRCLVDAAASRTASLRFLESWRGHAATLGCVCNATVPVLRFESLSSRSALVLEATQMDASEDFDDFRFEAKFEFFNSTLCETHAFVGRGLLEFRVPRTRGTRAAGALRCRWRIAASAPRRHVHLRFLGASPRRGCGREAAALLVYWDLRVPPVAKACVEGTPLRELGVFSPLWLEPLLHDPREDRLFVEVVVPSPSQGVRLRLRWLEVTRPFYRGRSGRPLRSAECGFECPEIGACIDAPLRCDGVSHCPSGADEAAETCRPFARATASLAVATAALLLLVASAALAAWALLRRRRLRRTEDAKGGRGDEEFYAESPLG